MRSPWVHAAIAALALAAVLAWPLSPALDSGTTFAGRLTATLACLAICGAMIVIPPRIRRSRRLWGIASVLLFVTAALLLFAHITIASSCVAEYDDRQVLVGRELQPWVRLEPGATSRSLLFDAAGNAAAVWTPRSIQQCGWILSWAVMLCFPLFAFAGSAGVCAFDRGYVALAPPHSPPAPVEPGSQQYLYDAFISYRHIEPDRTFAFELLSDLEAAGVRAVIDVRDFVPNRHFLAEMERCAKQSRFVLCVITPRYVESDHCLEEAVLSKTIDLSERRQRIVPLIMQRVELPVWLHGIVAIDFTPDSPVDPYGRLLALLTSETQRATTRPSVRNAGNGKPRSAG